MIQKRNIGMSIFLSIITCGIYSIFWFISLNDDINLASEMPGTSGGTAFLLNLITCGIYGLYWMYKQGEKIDVIKTKRGFPSSNSGVIYLVLGIFGLGLVSFALMQDELNKVAQ